MFWNKVSTNNWSITVLFNLTFWPGKWSQLQMIFCTCSLDPDISPDISTPIIFISRSLSELASKASLRAEPTCTNLNRDTSSYSYRWHRKWRLHVDVYTAYIHTWKDLCADIDIHIEGGGHLRWQLNKYVCTVYIYIHTIYRRVVQLA